MKKSYRAINYWKLVWKIATSKKFRFWFDQTYKYAIENAADKRGSGSSDVCIFIGREYDTRVKY